jgi:hypothetical protein
MCFFHMPYLSLFGYLWDIGHMYGEMAMWGYALGIFEVYMLWDSPILNQMLILTKIGEMSSTHV